MIKKPQKRAIALLFFCLLIGVQNVYAQTTDTDGDGIIDLSDLDNDNDGILDANECDLSLSDIYQKYVNGNANYEDGGNPDYFLTMRPSDFGVDFNNTPQNNLNLSHDYSNFFGLPIGSIIINLTNAHVHPTADAFYTQAPIGATNVVVSGTVGTYLQLEHGVQYYSNQSRTITINDGATVTNGSLYELNHTNSDGLTWLKETTHPNYTLINLTNAFQSLGLLNYAEINPERTHDVSFSTNDNVSTHYSTFFMRIYPECDYDKDGIPNRLDTDSDNDGCPDAVEGSASFTEDDLINQILGNTVDTDPTSITYGVPIVAGAGQTKGDAQNENVNACICFLDGSGTPLTTNIGISTLDRNTERWFPQNAGGYLKLESDTKPLVITRMDAPETAIGTGADAVAGMLVWDMDDNCLKLFNGTEWKCLKQSCNQ